MSKRSSVPPASQAAPSDDPVAQASAAVDLRAMPRVLPRLVRLALKYRWRCALAAGAALGAAVFSLITPRLLGQAVDEVFRLLAADPGGDEVQSALLSAALLIVGTCTLRGIFTGLQGYLGESIAQRVGYDLRLAFFDKLQQLGFRFHDRNHSGDLIARGMLDLEGVRGFIESAVLRVLALALLLSVGAWRVLQADLLLGALSLSFVPFVVVRAARMGYVLRQTWTRLQQLMSDLTLSMEENLQGMRVVRAFAARKHELARFDRVADAALRVSDHRFTVRMRSMSLMTLAYHVAMGLVLGVGGWRIAGGTLTVGMLTELLVFMAVLQQPVRQVGMIVNASARATSAGGRLFEVLDARDDVADAPEARDLQPGAGVLRFERVDFAYRPGGRKALSDVSFEVRAGERLGIVGPPGSGKSTLVNLVARFYDPDAGRITLDGQDLRTVTLASLRRAVRLVQQESFLFDASVRDNVAYAEPGVADDAVHAAAGVAQIHAHVAGLPEGYATRVGERGVSLSGGQRQRLSIARGLIPRPALIVLDDATAAIDASTERQVHEALRGALRGITTLIVAHRLGALRDADRIIVLDAGRIVEEGSHAALLARGGRYAALWRLQCEGERDGGGAAGHARPQPEEVAP
ncbi:ABC transporter ATP-binding protein [Thauera sinica]|uniref:ABC transporter ATP-binding protein n=1 Tax=Thauera sinica TaxID=2665146 RepID=A0ABW1AM17_9RHOO|nr:ABC transporter ATP-binding protein [Thauera sp. K11]ATE59168.1 multidrug ABC transporter [Thauera sp. K11]